MCHRHLKHLKQISQQLSFKTQIQVEGIFRLTFTTRANSTGTAKFQWHVPATPGVVFHYKRCHSYSVNLNREMCWLLGYVGVNFSVNKRIK